ncbi:MAG: thiamine diphosphokinase [Alphaproteobacteria bacterium]|nr:thiamine diphosphokinase [Alphaproteobacteria bacterium]
MTYKSILCLNGDLPPRDFFETLSLPIIAADGAANKLHKLGITPNVVIGDLDSIDPHLEVERIYMEDQSRCDYEKSMDYLTHHGLLPTVIVGSSGGDLDHILNNINVFMTCPSGNLLYAPPLYGSVISQPQTFLRLPIYTKVSLIGLPQARLITQGLKWDLTNQTLCFPGFNACFNRTNENRISIQVLEGQILFLAHAFFLQES